MTWARLAGPAFRPLLTDVHVGARAEVGTPTWVRAVALWGRGAGVVSGALAARVRGRVPVGRRARDRPARAGGQPPPRSPSAGTACSPARCAPASACASRRPRGRRSTWPVADRSSRPSGRRLARLSLRAHPGQPPRGGPPIPGRAGRSRSGGWRSDGRPGVSLMETRRAWSSCCAAFPPPCPSTRCRSPRAGQVARPRLAGRSPGRRKVGASTTGPSTARSPVRTAITCGRRPRRGQWEIIRIGAARCSTKAR